MLLRLFLIVTGFVALTAFTAENKTTLIEACANSLSKAKELGRPIPEAAVKNRNAICACIGDGVGADTRMTAPEKVEVVEIYKLGATAKYDEARKRQRKLSAGANDTMRNLTRRCTAAFRKPPAKKDDIKKDGAKKEGAKKG